MRWPFGSNRDMYIAHLMVGEIVFLNIRSLFVSLYIPEEFGGFSTVSLMVGMRLHLKHQEYSADGPRHSEFKAVRSYAVELLPSRFVCLLFI